ncbi:hypothetical protein [Rhodovulum sp. MB263]|nr:hypothetical protein [Rhodovulum sp. MB263]
MVRLIKALFIIIILLFLGLVGFAYLGDLDPAQQTVTESLTLDVD